uniref:O-methyltransferase C-terminal domain-containing protein n=1 Tax=Nelumbo nucifera TaxID=4432 RepID=A0A822Z8M8_NELNU|nr:TPA_asm: hypothetical protein HUJ06_014032 [Nelumbo nucifera]
MTKLKGVMAWLLSVNFLTRNPNGISLVPLLLINHDKLILDSWCHLKDAILESGIPFSKARGMTFFEYCETDSRYNKLFNKAMSVHSIIVMDQILDTYNGFESLEEVVDVGGGTGTTLEMITSKYPQIKGINFDLPHVIAEAPSYAGKSFLCLDLIIIILEKINITSVYRFLIE